MKVRKIPLEVEAWKWNGNPDDLPVEIFNDRDKIFICELRSKKLTVKDVEITITVDIGDYIVRDVNGKYYPVKSDLFEKTFETVKETV